MYVLCVERGYLYFISSTNAHFLRLWYIVNNNNVLNHVVLTFTLFSRWEVLRRDLQWAAECLNAPRHKGPAVWRQGKEYCLYLPS